MEGRAQGRRTGRQGEIWRGSTGVTRSQFFTKIRGAGEIRLAPFAETAPRRRVVTHALLSSGADDFEGGLENASCGVFCSTRFPYRSVEGLEPSVSGDSKPYRGRFGGGFVP